MLEHAESFKKTLEGAEVVVDTSTLLLEGTNLLKDLTACQLILPIIVIKELEGKRSHPTVGRFARDWLRLIERLRLEHGDALPDGVPTFENPSVTLRVEPNHRNQQSIPEQLRDGSNDSTILAVAKNLADEGKKVVLLSNDLPLRLHASLELHLPAVEYNSTSVSEIKPFPGVIQAVIPQEDYAVSTAVNPQNDISIENLILRDMEFVDAAHAIVDVMVEGDPTVVDRYVLNGSNLEKLPYKESVPAGKLTNKIDARTSEQTAALYYLQKPWNEVPVVSLVGGAGTGKTLLSVANGIHAVQSGEYSKVMVFRSLHEMGQGQEMGFLPGDVDEKMAPWAGAIKDALDVLTRGRNSNPERQKLDRDNLESLIEVSPITYLRGRSLTGCYVILEEAQNFSRSEIFNVLSRVGEGTKIVLTADSAQVDNKFLQSGNQSDIWSVVDSLKKEDIFAHVTLKKTERSKVAAVMSRLLAS